MNSTNIHLTIELNSKIKITIRLLNKMKLNPLNLANHLLFNLFIRFTTRSHETIWVCSFCYMKISMRLDSKINNKNVKIEIRNFIIVFFFGNQIMNY